MEPHTHIIQIANTFQERKIKTPDIVVDKPKEEESSSPSVKDRIKAFQQKKADEVPTESLEAALTNKEAVVKRRPSRPRELVDGRKRPPSKSIEEVLYPQRFSLASPSSDNNLENGALTPTKTEFRLRPSDGEKVKNAVR